LTNVEAFQREWLIQQRWEEERAAAWTSAETCMTMFAVRAQAQERAKELYYRRAAVGLLFERERYCINVA
jgi:hypothetical protein